MKKLIMALLIAALIMVCLPVTALADEGYIITDYDVYVTVSENNVLDVVERLTLNFTEQRHGFYHEVQIAGDYEGSRYSQRVYDYNVSGAPFELSRGGDYLTAKIGDADTLVTGEQEYVISYKCVVSDPSRDDFDKFYRNIINCAYGDTIENASFIIELPKDFDESEVNVLLGPYGSTDTSGVEWEKDGNTIKGHALRPITGGETVTVRMKFPEGYFVNETTTQPWDYVLYIISGLLVLISLILWFTFGRDDKIFPTVEFYPPDGMTSAEAGYVIDGCVDDKDVVSLILYWADKGYLRIDEKEKNEFELVKLKELEDAKSYEKTMFNKLFKDGDAVALSSLKYSFYTTMSSTKSGVSNYFEGAKSRQLYTKASNRARTFMGLATMLPIALALLHFVYSETYELMSGVIVAAIVSVLISLPVFMLVRVAEKWRSTKEGSRIAGLVISVVLLALAIFGYVVITPFVASTASWSVVAVTAVATLIMLPLTIIMKKRTKQGGEWLAKLIGFKNFIDKAEKDRILLLVEQNPSYFYNVLPYAYVLGVTDKWAKNFEGIGVEPPSWYRGYYGSPIFNAWLFTSMMTHNMSQFQSAMVSKPASQSGGFGGGGGGGFGGGGFSGGGFGGGGAGGSW
jgi:uncharacterized membrane protein YgcG